MQTFRHAGRTNRFARARHVPTSVRLWSCAVSTVVATIAALSASAEEHFELTQIATSERTVAAELADLDGDGHTDLLQIVFDGIPPDQTRRARVFPHVASKREPFQVDLPDGAAGYDVGEVDGSPGVELVLLRQNQITLLSLRRGAVQRRDLALPWGSIAARGEERSITRMRLFESTPNGPWLIAQGFGRLAVLKSDGTLIGDMPVGGVLTHYKFESPGLGFAEAPVEVNYVPARVSVANVDAGGKLDIVTASRHDIRVFLQREDGSFPRNSDQAFPLSLVAQGDYIRGSGGATAYADDIDGDGLADLLISQVTGGITDAGTIATFHLNRGGRWDLENADQRMVLSDRGSLTLYDLDADGRPELVQMTTPFSAMEIIEALATRSLDANIAIFQAGNDKPFQDAPWSTSKLSLPINFETFAPSGFLPSWLADLNGDGHRDMITSGSGDRLEVYLGGPQYRYEDRAARQTVGNSGELTAGDIDGDRRTDLLIYDPHRAGEPVKLLRNRGTLPGSPAVFEKP